METFGEQDQAEEAGLVRRAVRFLKDLPRLSLRIALENSWISLVLAVSVSTFLALAVLVVLPGYSSPMSRLYSSKFGYGSLLRKLHKPFPVTSTFPVRRRLNRSCLGEGLVRSEPLIVSIIPMGTIKKMYVKDGDLVKKGQLLAEVEATIAEIKADAARAAVATANAELERVRIGSAYILTYERPKLDTIKRRPAERGSTSRNGCKKSTCGSRRRGLPRRKRSSSRNSF